MLKIHYSYSTCLRSISTYSRPDLYTSVLSYFSGHPHQSICHCLHWVMLFFLHLSRGIRFCVRKRNFYVRVKLRS